MALRARFELHVQVLVFERSAGRSRCCGPRTATIASASIDVHAARPVALLAADVDFLPRRVIRVRLRVVILVHVRRMAIGAGRVPILGDAGPMQRVARQDSLVGHIGRRDEEPLLVLHVPRFAQHLHPAIGELDHVLLQRPHAERVLDFVVVILAVGPLGVDHELAAVAKEPRSHAVVLELRVVEVGLHGFVGGQVHRPVVVRAHATGDTAAGGT